MTEPKFTVGDEVRLFDINSAAQRSHGRDPGEPGTVTKVGRTRVTVADKYGNTQTFHMEDGRCTDGWGHQWVRTTAEATEEVRRWDAVAKLRGYGITVTRSALVSTEQLVAMAACLPGKEER